MIKNKKKILLFIIVAFMSSACAMNKTTTTAPDGEKGTVCTQQYDPVCGSDGETYSNSCFAGQKPGVTIMYSGACRPASTLNNSERKQLAWLLSLRMNLKLPAVSIKHLYTQSQDCNNCYTVYYSWGNPRVIARIIVERGTITSATDTLGYNYVAKKQEAPIDFPELMQAKEAL